MSYNGSGTFSINSAGQPVITGTIISSTAFNALTADLATGLSTAITKDGQTTTTVRVPFAAGISSTLVTDATSALTGSIITAGGISMQKALWVGTTSRLVGNVQADGLVGIGRSPAYKLHVSTGSATSVIASFTDSVNQGVHIGTTTTGVYFNQENSGFLGFQIGGTEKARFDTSGNLCVGTSVALSSGKISTSFDGSTGENGHVLKTTTASLGSDYLQFYNSAGSIAGYIRQSGTTTVSFTSVSDARLKNDLGKVTDTSVIDKTIIHDYIWKIDNTKDRGVFAQEAYEIIPSAIGVGNDDLNEDGNLKKPWGVDYSKYVPDLIVYCQQLKLTVQELTTRLAALENK